MSIADVVVGRGTNDQLFLVGGSQSVLNYVSGERLITTEVLQRFCNNLDGRASFCAQRHIPYQHIVCPDKHSVLSSDFPFEIKVQIGKLFQEHCKFPFLFPVDELRATPTKSYWKTDTHWDLYGRMVFARLVAGNFGFDAEYINTVLDAVLKTAWTNDAFCGDLGSKLEPREVESGFAYRRPNHVVQLSNRVTGSNGTITITINNKSRPLRLFICGDSFAIQCLDILSLFFREILLVRSPYFHNEIVDLYRPSHILTENVERYLPSMPSDKAAPIGFLLPYLLGKQGDPDKGFFEALNAICQPDSVNHLVYAKKYLG